MKILLIRHGESRHNARLEENKDSVLTRRGKLQAKYLGMRLKKQKISAIYTSNLLRSKETGEIISKIIKVPIKGHFEELAEYQTRNLKSPAFRLFNKRMNKLKKFLKQISKDRKKDKTILIIAHGITNRIIMGVLLQIPLKNLIRFRQHNASVNEIFWNEEYKDWVMLSMNDIGHLPRRIREEYGKS